MKACSYYQEFKILPWEHIKCKIIYVAKKRGMQVNVKLLYTVTQAYSQHAYNDLMLIVRRFSFPVWVLNIVLLRDLKN